MLSGIAVDSGGAIYLADAERGNILIFFPDGTFLRAMHSPAAARISRVRSESALTTRVIFMSPIPQARV